jgi:hypothetical protein
VPHSYRRHPSDANGAPTSGIASRTTSGRAQLGQNRDDVDVVARRGWSREGISQQHRTRSRALPLAKSQTR